MNIVIVNGSTRKNGATAKMLKQAAGYLEQKEGTTVEYIDLNEYQIAYCTGCRVCYRTGTCCIKKDGIEELAARIKKADGVLMGSSTFGSYYTSLLKSFMDRGHFLVEQSLNNNYSFSLITYELAEGDKAMAALKKFFMVAGSISGGSMLFKLDFNADPFKKEKTEQKLFKKMDRFYNVIKKKKKRSLYEFIFSKVVLRPVFFKPAFMKRKKEYMGVLKIWKEKGLLKEAI